MYLNSLVVRKLIKAQWPGISWYHAGCLANNNRPFDWSNFPSNLGEGSQLFTRYWIREEVEQWIFDNKNHERLVKYKEPRTKKPRINSLVDAAPEMLAALEAVASDFHSLASYTDGETGDDLKRISRQVEDAIAKARRIK